MTAREIDDLDIQKFMGCRLFHRPLEMWLGQLAMLLAVAEASKGCLCRASENDDARFELYATSAAERDSRELRRCPLIVVVSTGELSDLCGWWCGCGCGCGCVCVCGVCLGVSV